MTNQTENEVSPRYNVESIILPFSFTISRPHPPSISSPTPPILYRNYKSGCCPYTQRQIFRRAGCDILTKGPTALLAAYLGDAAAAVEHHGIDIYVFRLAIGGISYIRARPKHCDRPDALRARNL